MNKLAFGFALSGFLLLASSPLFARDILGSHEAEAKAWAAEKGYQAGAVATGKEGCLKGHRYLAMSGPGGLKVEASFYNPLYKTDTQVVAMVDFIPASPIGKKQAEAYAVQAAPIAGTRPPTHRHPIEAEAGNPCAPPHGGQDGRYTGDYIAEYFFAPDKTRIERVRVYNDGIH